MFRTKEDMIDVYGWSQSARILYLIDLIGEGKTKDEIELLVTEHQPQPLMKPKSFELLWNKYQRISDKLEFVHV